MINQITIQRIKNGVVVYPGVMRDDLGEFCENAIKLHAVLDRMLKMNESSYPNSYEEVWRENAQKEAEAEWRQYQRRNRLRVA